MGAWKDCYFRVNQEADTNRRKKSILNKGFVVFFFFLIYHGSRSSKKKKQDKFLHLHLERIENGEFEKE
jgi:hypothetical protein